MDTLTITASEFVEQYPYGREDAQFFANGMRVIQANAGLHTNGRYWFRVAAADGEQVVKLRPATVFAVAPLTEQAERIFTLTATQRKWLHEFKHGARVQVGDDVEIWRGSKRIGKMRPETHEALKSFLQTEDDIHYAMP